MTHRRRWRRVQFTAACLQLQAISYHRPLAHVADRLDGETMSASEKMPARAYRLPRKIVRELGRFADRFGMVREDVVARALYSFMALPPLERDVMSESYQRWLGSSAKNIRPRDANSYWNNVNTRSCEAAGPGPESSSTRSRRGKSAADADWEAVQQAAQANPLTRQLLDIILSNVDQNGRRRRRAK